MQYDGDTLVSGSDGYFSRVLASIVSWPFYDAWQSWNCSVDATVRIWDPRSRFCCKVLGDHVAPVTCLQFQGRVHLLSFGVREWTNITDVLLASGSLDGRVFLYDIRMPDQRECLFPNHGSISCLHLNIPSLGRVLVSLSRCLSPFPLCGWNNNQQPFDWRV